MNLPAAIRPLVDFPPLLRANGFAVAPDQTIGFVEAVSLLGPNGIDDIRRASLALFAIPPERRGAFDALFAAHFLGASLPQTTPDDDEDEAEAHEGTGQSEEIPEEPHDDPGDDATVAERLGHRRLEGSATAALLSLRRHASARLPRRRARRLRPARNGRSLDLRRALKEAARRDGEVLTLPRQRRQTQQRRVVLLIDVSGSMQADSEQALRLAHTLVQTADRVEVFTLATRLTRVTPALKLANPGRALERASALIADIDGGTRIGEALAAFLAVPRYAGFARGAAVIVLSDGLERGEPDQLVSAITRLGRLSWRLDWLSPLAPEGVPQTQALQAILPNIDHLGDGSSSEAIARHLLTMAEAA